MKLREKGGIWYVRFSHKGKRYERSTGESKIGRATTVATDIIRDIVERGKHPLLRKTPTLQQIASDFLAEQEALERSGAIKPKTVKYYQNGWRLLATTSIAKMPVDEIGTSDARKLVFPGSGSNANNALSTLRRMLTFACERKIIRAAPQIDRREEERREEIIPGWLEDILLELAPDRFRDAILLGRDCGLRPNEIAALRWEDIKWDDNKVFVARGKTKRARRFIPLSHRLRAALKQNEQKSEWVFPSTGKSGRVSKIGHMLSSSLDKAWSTLMVKVREECRQRRYPLPSEELVFYSTRHTFISTLAVEKVDVATIARLAGHSDIRTTMRYVHMVADLEAADVINKRTSTRRVSALTLIAKQA